MGWLGGCATVGSAGSLVEYSRTGGFAGVNDRLIIDTGGKAVLATKAAKSEFTVSRDVLDKLRKSLDDAGFAKLKKEYLPAPGSADLFEYLITYQGYTVRTADSAVPEKLQPAFDLLNGIIAGER